MNISSGQGLSVLPSKSGLARRDRGNDTPERSLKLMLVAIALLAAASGQALAQGFKMIANPSVQVDSITASDLKSIYLREKTSLGSVHVEPVFAKTGPAHEAFLRHLLGQTDSELQNYYRTLVFTGRGTMPKALDSDGEVVAYVARTHGAIGYVSPDASAEHVRTLDLVIRGISSDRKLVYRVEPDYPDLLRQRSIGGTVRLRVLVAPSGKVQEIALIGGDAALGESAAAAVSKWKYSPASSQTTTEVAITFDPHR